MVLQINKPHNQTSTSYVFLILQWCAIRFFSKGKKKYFFQTICNFQTTTKKSLCQCIWYVGWRFSPESSGELPAYIKSYIHNNILMPTNTVRKQILHKWSELSQRVKTHIITGGNLMTHDLLHFNTSVKEKTIHRFLVTIQMSYTAMYYNFKANSKNSVFLNHELNMLLRMS